MASFTRLAYVLAALVQRPAGAAAFDWAVVCDAGSTGMRAYAYHMGHAVRWDTVVDSHEGPKVKPGLSTFGTNPAGVGEYVAPLVEAAKKLVPESEHATTPFFVKATAGMRLIPEEQQIAVFDALFSALLQQRCPFIVKRENMGVIDGETEGFYGLLAANHLKHRIRPNNLHPMSEGLVGALDLGGSSTQITFLPPGKATQFHGLSQAEIYVHSYLGFGAELAREKVMAGSAKAASSAGARVDCPCFFPGYEIPALDKDGNNRATLVGTGDAVACRALIEEFVLSEPAFAEARAEQPDLGTHDDARGTKFIGHSKQTTMHY